MYVGKGVLIVEHGAEVHVLPTFVNLIHAARTLLVTCRSTNPVVILHLIIGMLTVLFYHLVGSVTSQGQSLEQLLEVVSSLHVATQGGKIVVIGTTIEQTADRIAAS